MYKLNSEGATYVVSDVVSLFVVWGGRPIIMVSENQSMIAPGAPEIHDMVQFMEFVDEFMGHPLREGK